MASILSYALCSLADVKESLGISSSDTSWDNLCIRKINQATRQIEKYCNRRFAETTYTDEEYNATGLDQLVLKNYPVTDTVTFSIKERDTGLNENSFDTIDTELYFVDNDSGVINSTFRFNGHWKRYRVTYSAGYATIPDDLAEACAGLAAYYTLNADTSDVGVQEKQEGQRRIKYSNNVNQPKTFMTICQQLGIDETLNEYAANPVTPDR